MVLTDREILLVASGLVRLEWGGGPKDSGREAAAALRQDHMAIAWWKVVSFRARVQPGPSAGLAGVLNYGARPTDSVLCRRI